MTQNQHPDSSNSRRALSSYLVPIAFMALFLIPVLFYGFGSEMARWHQARANLFYQDGRVDEAVGLMVQALQKSPDDQKMKLNLSEMLMQNGQPEKGLELIDEVLTVATDRTPALRTRAECLLYLDRPDDALETVKQISDDLQPEQIQQAARLNELAYFRALAGKELVVAETDIASAINTTARSMLWQDGFYLPLEDQTLVAAAIISRRIERQEDVLELLDRRIGQFEVSLLNTEDLLTRTVYSRLLSNFPFLSQQETEVRNLDSNVQFQKQFLSLLYSVRALLFQDHGRKHDSDRDRYAAQKLGYDAGQLIATIPDDWQLLFLLVQGAELLDTRAMVTGARGFPKRALPDIDIAVLASSLLNSTFSGPIQNTIRDESGTMFEPARTRRVEAVLRKHRADLLLKLQQYQQSENEWQKIEELGFDRNEKLF